MWGKGREEDVEARLGLQGGLCGKEPQVIPLFSLREAGVPPLQLKKKKTEDYFPGGPVVKTCALPLSGARSSILFPG